MLPDLGDYLTGPYSRSLENVLARHLRSLPEEERLSEIEQMVEHDPALGLTLARRCLHHPKYFDAFLRRGLAVADQAGLEIWMRGTLPVLGMSRVCGILEELLWSDPQAVERAMHWLPKFLSRSGTQDHAIYNRFSRRHQDVQQEWQSVSGQPGMSPRSSKPVSVNKYGMTELHSAAYHGELNWVQNCLAGGLSVGARDNFGNTPLHWAADMAMVDGDREEIVRELIRAGASVNAKRSGGETVLMVACSSGNRDVVFQLLHAGADASLRSDKDQCASDFTELEEIKIMLKSDT